MKLSLPHISIRSSLLALAAVLILADMADLRPVALDNVLYVTTKENAEDLQARQDNQRNKAYGPEKPASPNEHN